MIAIEKLQLPIAILAGGLATRLHPLTEDVPKSLIPILGRPFIDWQLELLARKGATRVVVCVGHLGEMIASHVGDGSRFGLEVRYSHDGKVLRGTGGALLQAIPSLGNEFFVLYGDSFLPVDYRKVEAAFLNSPKPGLMTVFENQGRWDRSNVWMDGTKIRSYDKQAPLPEMGHIDYGLSVLRAETFQGRSPGESFDLADLLGTLVQRHQVAAYCVKDRFYEIGSLAGIADLERFLSSTNWEQGGD